MFVLCSCKNREETPLLDLHKMTEDEKGGNAIKINNNIPSYTENGVEINKKHWGNYAGNPDYDREYYTDKTRNVKAVVFIKAMGSKNITPPLEKGAGKIGTPAINFEISDLNGNMFKLAELRGKVVVLNFWFIGCKPCVLEMPDLNGLKAKYNTADIVFAGITFDNINQVKTFLKKTPFNYTILTNAKEICKKWGVSAFPTNIIIDKQGIVRFEKIGLSKNIQSDLDASIKSLL
jgi:peroxiredoxin